MKSGVFILFSKGKWSQNKLTMTENELLDRFYEYYDARDYPEAEKIIRRIIKNGDTSAWAFTKLSSTLYEQKKYGWALFYGEKAYGIDSHNPITIWHLAGAYFGTKNYTTAIKYWKKLKNHSSEEIGLKLTTMGLGWANRLLNDLSFCIGEGYYKLYQDKEAKKYLMEYREQETHQKQPI